MRLAHKKEKQMKITVLDRLAMGDDLDFSIFSDLGELEVFDTTSAQQVSERVTNSNIILTNKVKITAQVMQSAKNLQLICVFATGYDNIDLAYAKEHGVGVCNVPAYSTESVTLFLHFSLRRSNSLSLATRICLSLLLIANTLPCVS